MLDAGLQQNLPRHFLVVVFKHRDFSPFLQHPMTKDVSMRYKEIGPMDHKLQTGDRVRDSKGQVGTVDEVGDDQLHATIHWDSDEAGVTGPSKIEDLALAEKDV